MPLSLCRTRCRRGGARVRLGRREVSAAPRTLSAAGRARSVEAPGFPVHHLGISWSGPDQAGALRLRYADGWGDWRPLLATESADSDRHSNLSFVGDAQAYEFEPAEGLVTVLASLARVTAVNPLGTTSYVNPISGATKTVATLAGHRDWAAAECPGNTYYPSMPQLRADVAAALYS